MKINVKYLVLDKAINGLIQAARQFHKRLTKAMEEDMGFDKFKEEGEMKEYVGCKVERRGRDNLIMFQDDLINKIEKIFGDKVKNMQEYGMPTGSGEHIKRPDEGESTLGRDDQTTYRRGSYI